VTDTKTNTRRSAAAKKARATQKRLKKLREEARKAQEKEA
jgi:hypothetical protein